MNQDDNRILDVEAVEIEDSDNLPAVASRPLSGQTSTHEHREPMRKWSEEWWSAQTSHLQSRRCRAHSSRTGEPCKNLAIQGSTACRYHGGAAKHVKAAARARLENAAELMAKQLLGIALTADSEAVKLAAIKDSLDRAGLKAPAEVVLSQGDAKPYEAVFDSIGGDPAAAGFPSVPSDDFEPAGNNGSPAPAYDQFGIDGKAEAGAAAPGFGGTGQHDAQPEAADQGQSPSPSDPPRRAHRRNRDRDTQPQPRARHITGEAAMQVANWANRAMAESHGLPWGESDRRRR